MARHGGDMRVPYKAWIVVGDGEKALFLENRGDPDHPDFHVLRTLSQENPSTREQGADRPGRFNDGPSVQRSAVDDTDWHRIEKDRFAREIADLLYAAAHRGDFDNLVVVAPPHVLGELRHALHTEVTDRLVGTLDKTLTNHPIDAIEDLLGRD